jgi:hypothetical protein
MTDLLRLIAGAFDGCRIIIETPDRSDRYRKVIDELSRAGIKGIWRVRKEKR